MKRRHRLVGVLSRTEFALLAITGSREQQLLRISSHAPAPQGDFSVALRQLKRRPRGVTLRLCRDLGLRKLLSLPLAARNDLAHLLRYEMDRLSPFGADNVYFAHRVVHVDAEERGIRVEVQIVPRNTVERALAIVKCLGLQPKRLELADASADGTLNLLPRQAIESSRVSRLDSTLAALLLASAAAAMAIALHKQNATAADFDHEVAVARQEAEKSLNLLQNIDTLTSTMKFIVDHKKVNIMLTRVLAELSLCIPDEAYLAQLDMNDRDVRMHGYAHSASDLIRSLEQSPLFGKAEFLSPITIDPHNGRERFQIAVRIRPTDG